MQNVRFLIKLKQKRKLELIAPNEEVKESYLKKSDSNLISSKILLENNKLEEAVSLAYYSAYNLLLSLLFRTGIKSENHYASIILLKEIFDLSNDFLLSARKERIRVQYYVDFNITKNGILELISKIEEFNADLSDFISKLTNERIDFYRNKFIKIIESK